MPSFSFIKKIWICQAYHMCKINLKNKSTLPSKDHIFQIYFFSNLSFNIKYKNLHYLRILQLVWIILDHKLQLQPIYNQNKSSRRIFSSNTFFDMWTTTTFSCISHRSIHQLLSQLWLLTFDLKSFSNLSQSVTMI